MKRTILFAKVYEEMQSPIESPSLERLEEMLNSLEKELLSPIHEKESGCEETLTESGAESPKLFRDGNTNRMQRFWRTAKWWQA